MNRDRLHSLHCHAATTGAFAALDGIQVMPPEQQVAGTAMLFVAMADELGLDPSELIDQARRRMKDDDTFAQTEVKSLRAYIQGELK